MILLNIVNEENNNGSYYNLVNVIGFDREIFQMDHTRNDFGHDAIVIIVIHVEYFEAYLCKRKFFLDSPQIIRNKLHMTYTFETYTRTH